MEQRGAGEPRHERRVLDRVPEPPAAPAELVVGPVAAERDAEAQRAPGGERPGPHPARPAGVDPALDQRGDREGEGHREADIAGVEHRRVGGERQVLQDRVEALAVGRRRIEPQERVRGEQHEGEEAHPDQPLHGRAPAPGTAPAGCARTARRPRRRARGSRPTGPASPRGCPRPRRSCRSRACSSGSWRRR